MIRGNKPLYVGQRQDKIIYLYHTERGTPEAPEGHYDAINSITGALGVAYFCDKCFIGYNTKTQHKCAYICTICLSQECRVENSYEPIQCSKCNITCRNAECYTRHMVAPKDRGGGGGEAN